MIVKDAICFRNTSGRSSPRRRRTRRSRSHARWAGRAAARPQSKLRCGGGERATFGSGGARKYGCDQTGCGGLSVVEQPASLIGALNSPHDKSADERQSLETKPISRGTESSNPVPSSGESGNLRSLRRATAQPVSEGGYGTRHCDGAGPEATRIMSSPAGSPERRSRIAFIGSSRDPLSAIIRLRKMPSPPSISTSPRYALMAERRG